MLFEPNWYLKCLNISMILFIKLYAFSECFVVQVVLIFTISGTWAWSASWTAHPWWRTQCRSALHLSYRVTSWLWFTVRELYNFLFQARGKYWQVKRMHTLVSTRRTTHQRTYKIDNMYLKLSNKKSRNLWMFQTLRQVWHWNWENVKIPLSILSKIKI